MDKPIKTKKLKHIYFHKYEHENELKYQIVNGQADMWLRVRQAIPFMNFVAENEEE